MKVLDHQDPDARINLSVKFKVWHRTVFDGNNHTRNRKKIWKMKRIEVKECFRSFGLTLIRIMAQNKSFTIFSLVQVARFPLLIQCNESRYWLHWRSSSNIRTSHHYIWTLVVGFIRIVMQGWKQRFSNPIFLYNCADLNWDIVVIKYVLPCGRKCWTSRLIINFRILIDQNFDARIKANAFLQCVFVKIRT